MADDLERLRDILFGSQARTIEQRLNDLEAELVAARQALAADFEQKLGVANAQHLALSQRVAQQAEHSDTRDAEILQQLEATRQSLSDQLDRLGREQSERLQAEAVDSRERLERARAEIQASLEALQAQKVAREDLGQMLIDLGQRLRNHQPS